MQILADCPDECDRLEGESAKWTRIDCGASQWGDLLSAMSGKASMWMTRSPRLDANGGLSCLLIIDLATTSQFDALIRALNEKRSLPPGTAVIALEGRSFHGLRGRRWQALRGNIHLSVYYPLAVNAAATSGALTMLPALAVVDAVRTLCGEQTMPGIKWVNDIFIDGKKVAGVLTNTQLQGSNFHNVVFGIGLNVEATPEIEADTFVPATTCLNALEGVEEVRMMNALWVLLNALECRFNTFLSDGLKPMLEAYREFSLVLGRQVRIWKESTETIDGLACKDSLLAKGTVDAIEADLSLRIRGTETPVRGGRLAFEEVCQSFE